MYTQVSPFVSKVSSPSLQIATVGVVLVPVQGLGFWAPKNQTLLRSSQHRLHLRGFADCPDHFYSNYLVSVGLFEIRSQLGLTSTFSPKPYTYTYTRQTLLRTVPL